MKENEIEDFKVEISRFGKYSIITFGDFSQIDLYSIKEIVQLFENGNQEGVEDWVVDLSKIIHIDSSGLSGLANQGMLLAKKSKRLLLLSPNSRIKHLFSVTGFNKIFTVVLDRSFLPS